MNMSKSHHTTWNDLKGITIKEQKKNELER